MTQVFIFNEKSSMGPINGSFYVKHFVEDTKNLTDLSDDELFFIFNIDEMFVHGLAGDNTSSFR